MENSRTSSAKKVGVDYVEFREKSDWIRSPRHLKDGHL